MLLSLLLCSRRNDVDAPVLLPACFVVVFAYGLIFSVAHDVELGIGDADLHQIGLGGLGAGIAEREVVLFGAALIGVAFDGEVVIGILNNDVAQFGGIGLQRFHGVGTQFVLVVIEIRVFDTG